LRRWAASALLNRLSRLFSGLRQFPLHGFQLPLHGIDLALQLLLVGVGGRGHQMRCAEHRTGQNHAELTLEYHDNTSPSADAGDCIFWTMTSG